MAGDHMDFEDYPNIGYGREQARGSDGKFYFKLDETRCEFGGYYSANSNSAALALDVPTGKKLHIRTVVGVTPVAAGAILKLREGSATGTVIYRQNILSSGAGVALAGIHGLVCDGDVYAEFNTAATGAGIFIGGILDPDPTRE
jgi:hypothetical protein